ncbi:MAG: hypothetical protein ACAH95_00640 [Fimbriimonas sp.]
MDKHPSLENQAVIDLPLLIKTVDSSGPLWGTESEQLDATLLFWRRGEGIARHVNDEVDVLIMFLKGSAVVSIGEQELVSTTGQVVLIPRGSERSLVALEDCAHLNVHQRRKKLSPMATVGSYQKRQLPES